MDELKDLLIALALVIIPAISAILKKSQKKAPAKKVIARPVTSGWHIEEEPAPIKEKTVPKTTPVPDPPFSREPIAALHPQEKEPYFSPEEKKKLVIYSEIMKPKFDA